MPSENVDHTTLSDAEIFDRYVQEVRDRQEATVRFELEIFPALVVVGNLQLALGHLDNSDPSSALTRKIALEIEKEIGAIGGPAIRETLRRGWLREDEPEAPTLHVVRKRRN